MGDPTILSNADLQLALDIIAELAELPRNPALMRRHFLERSAQVIESPSYIWTLTADADGIKGPPMNLVAVHNWSERTLAWAHTASQDREKPPPEYQFSNKIQQSGRHRTFHLGQIMDREEWRTTAHAQMYRKPMDMGDFLYSLIPLNDAGLLSGLGYHRRWNCEPFTKRDVAMIHVMAQRLHWLLMADVDHGVSSESIAKLSPRLRSMLGLIVDGMNRKHIASHLGLSEETIKKYSKQVYRAFGVGSQVELMRLFHRGHIDLSDHLPDQEDDQARSPA